MHLLAFCIVKYSLKRHDNSFPVNLLSVHSARKTSISDLSNVESAILSEVWDVEEVSFFVSATSFHGY